ncbi:unnamed protein product [Effrenium voratum]|nr:unnamed protein product [Effrenium voratum]
MGAIASVTDCVGDGEPKARKLNNKHLQQGGLLDRLFDTDSCGLYKNCEGERNRSILSSRLLGLLEELFAAHDLNKNGLLEELELIQLNKKIVLLHHGRNADMEAVKAKYQDLFRRKLNAQGDAVPFSIFKAYMSQVLVEVDPDPAAQEMMLEQWLAEAQAARALFHMPSITSVTDLPFLSTISFDKDDLPAASRASIDTASTAATPRKEARNAWASAESTQEALRQGQCLGAAFRFVWSRKTIEQNIDKLVRHVANKYQTSVALIVQ